MKKATIALLCLLFSAVFFVCEKIFAEENVNKTEATIEEFQATEANLANLPEGSVPLEKEMEDEEVVSADS